MLSRVQWQWLADHQKGAGTFVRIMFWVMAATYFYNFLDVFWWQAKVPLPYQNKGSLMVQLKCFDEEFFISGLHHMAPLERKDSSTLLLENHLTSTLGSEILEKRPECMGAYISYTAGRTDPFAILVVDRGTGKDLYRVAYLRDYLKR